MQKELNARVTRGLNNFIKVILGYNNVNGASCPSNKKIKYCYRNYFGV
jgi:hypothetical protein